MSIEILIAFIATCILLGLTPGPNMSLIIANTLRGGLASGFVTLQLAFRGSNTAARQYGCGVNCCGPSHGSCRGA